MDNKEKIIHGKTSLGLELGSTRIKAVLIDETHAVLASSEHGWENRFVDGIWTYSLEDIKTGIQSCYEALKYDVKLRYGITLTKIGSIGISAMMHGYMVFDKADNLLVPFRTWRNNNAESAAKDLTKLFNYPIPARWSIAHLYQAVKNKEPHIKDIAFQTTLEGYVHYILTGEKVIGIGEASGMFPIDLSTKNYNKKMIGQFDQILKQNNLNFTLDQIFPKVLLAGENAGSLTASGAKFLDPSGELQAGCLFCAPEGDAGTGMVATNSVKVGTGNISAGTSIFGMLVLDKELSKVYPEIDLVTTPSGELVAMVHCNNCTSEINAWVNLFEEFASLTGSKVSKNEIYVKLFESALKGEDDCGGLLLYNYLSGENITQIDEGRPTFVRTTESNFNLSNFMRSQIYSAFATLKIGLDILFKKENVKSNFINAHGGIFKTEGVAQRFLAAAINTPIAINKTANEGGAWGMAVLAMFAQNGAGTALENYLDDRVFKGQDCLMVEAKENEVRGFERFTENYINGLSIVKEAVAALKR